MTIDRKTELNQCIKARRYIKLGWHTADARVVLRRSQRLLAKLRRQR